MIEQQSGISAERAILTWLVGGVLFFVTFYFLSSALMPFILGFALAYLLNPMVLWLQRWGFDRLGASIFILINFLLMFSAAGILVFPILIHQFGDLLTNLPHYFASVSAAMSSLSEQVASMSQEIYQKFGVEPGASTIDVLKFTGGFSSEGVNWIGGLFKSMASGGATVFDIFSLLLLVTVVAFYALVDWEKISKSVNGFIRSNQYEDVRGLLRDIDEAIAGFLHGQFLVCLFLGAWYSFGFSLIGLNFGLLIGSTAGVLSFVPYAGTLTAFVPSLLIGLVQGWPTWRLPLMVFGVVGAGLFLEGNILAPRLVGASVGLHPIWLMLALVVFGTAFGFSGLMIAAPVASVASVLARFTMRRLNLHTQ